MFRLITFGGLHLDGTDQSASVAAYRRSVALLVLIAAARARGVSREKLAGLLWPESDEERARHALSQTLYRLRQNVGTSAVEGTTALRLAPDAVAVDFAEFEDLLERGAWEQAIALYRGPFLDGFYLPGAPDFERWVEGERDRLAARYRDALERLAEEAIARRRFDRAAECWQRIASIAPLDSRVAVRLMQALADAGDLAAALQHARVYETLVREELDAEPDAAFVAARDALRTRPTSAPVRPAEIAPPRRRTSIPARVSDALLRIVVPRRIGIRLAVALTVTMAATVAAAFAFARGGEASAPVLAVGYIADYTGDGAGSATGTIAELLTTSLGRYRPLDVVSRARLYQLLPAASSEPEATAFARAAERAGVTELLDGELRRLADGTLRLDLRRLNIASGAVEQVERVEAKDPFALADSASRRLAGSLRVPSPDGVSQPGTRSLVALGFYEEGLRAYYQRGDAAAALALFSSALRADSGFAMAAFHAFRAAWASDQMRAREFLRLATLGANGASERERLLVAATWAHANEEPSRVDLAERFAQRFPRDPDAQWLLGQALTESGDFLGGAAAFRRLLALDSLDASFASARCTACDASTGLVSALLLADSLDAAERAAREWVAMQPDAPAPWLALSDVLAAKGDVSGAREAARHRLDAEANTQADPLYATTLALRAGDLDQAESSLQSLLTMGKPLLRSNAEWLLVILRRYQGRYDDALAIANASLRREPRNGSTVLLRAQVLFETGRYAEAANAFETRALDASRFPYPSLAARQAAWALTHLAETLAASGDTARLPELADSLEAIGARSGYGRDSRLHHHVRGLLMEARGRTREAINEYRRASYSPSLGYSRTNYHLAAMLLRAGEPKEAIAALRPALHGGVEASNLYLSRTEIHALLARAFAAAGQRDSAEAHLRLVRRAWLRADPDVRRRLQRIEADIR